MKDSKLTRTHKIILSIVCCVLGVALILIAYFLGSEWKDFLNYTINILGAIILFVGINMIYSLVKKNDKKLSVKKMTIIGVMSSISVILYYFITFKLPFFPPWLDIQFSEIPALIVGFAFGPYSGFLVILVRFIIKIPATITGGVGELADLILGSALVLISSIIYSRKRTIKGALLGTVVGVVSCTILSLLLNWFILIPAYIKIAGFPLSDLVEMMNYIPSVTITEENFMAYYLLIGVLPFNIFRYVLVSILTFLLYKRTHKVFIKIAK